MSEMIERVARVIHENHAFDSIGEHTPWDEVNDVFSHAQDDYRKVARAAIEAMREPTQEMKDVGLRDPGSGGPDPGYETEVWQAMLDEALKT